MGICIALMFGRLGAVFGTNVVALLLENYCESTFYLSGSTILGNVIQIPEFFIVIFNVLLDPNFSLWILSDFPSKSS